MKPLLLAFQFLTIIPVRVGGQVTGKDLSLSAAFFPVVGAFQGLLAVCACSVFLRVFSPVVASGLVLTVLVASSGGFHVDGLADTFDALAVKAGGDRNADRIRRLAVMKDSSTGAIGVTAIVIAILLKFLFLNSLLSGAPQSLAFEALFLMPVFSKWGMVAAMYRGRPARDEGLGKLFLARKRPGRIPGAFVLTALACVLAVMVNPARVPASGAVSFLLVLFAGSTLFSLLWARFCTARFGGLTGDNFGALGELSEIIFLMMVLLWFHGSI